MLVAHGTKAQRQQAPGNSYPRDGLSVSSTSRRDPRVQSTKIWIAFGRKRLGGLLREYARERVPAAA